MAIEMSASRLMAPYFGASVFVWTNLLGVIMMALALGYWWGGKLADKHPTPTFLYRLLLLAALLLLGLPLVAPWFMNFMSNGVQQGQYSLVIMSFVSSLVIFGVPFTVLGMVSPTIIRLLSSAVNVAGHTAGNVYAASTVGSILGTFLPTLVLVPWIGTKRTIILFAVILLILSLIGLGRKKWWVALGLFGVIFWLTPPQYFASADILYQTETPYAYVKVVKDDAGTVSLQQDEGYGLHSLYHPDQVWTGGYWDYMALMPYLQPDKVNQRVAVIGAAGGTAYRILAKEDGEAFKFTFTGAELDPQVIKLSKQYFGMNEIQPNVAAQDGRIWMKQTVGDYDIIFLDAYHQMYIPPQLSSQEFFGLARSKMSAGGIFVMNINSLFDGSEIYRRIVTTIQAVWPKVWVLKVGNDSYNFLVLATSNTALDFGQAMATVPTKLQDLARNATQQTTQPPLLKAELITDDKPLSEVLFDKMVGEWLLKIL